jgi:hypothetical protein
MVLQKFEMSFGSPLQIVIGVFFNRFGYTLNVVDFSSLKQLELERKLHLVNDWLLQRYF